MRLLISILLLSASLLADTGGLQSLPSLHYGNNTLSSANAGFESGYSWVGGWSANTDVYRSGSQAISTTEDATAFLTIPVNIRYGRVRFYVRTTGGDPGEDATVKMYLFDATHGWTAFACAVPMTLSGGLPDWTEYAICNFGVNHRHYGDSVQLRIIADNITGGTVHVDDIIVEPILQPLVIYPIYPNYRGMVWTDQGTALKWNALVQPHSGYAVDDLEVHVQMVRASDSQVMSVTRDNSLAPINSSGNWAGYSVNAMEYDVSRFADGSYLLRGILCDKSDGSVVGRSPV